MHGIEGFTKTGKRMVALYLGAGIAGFYSTISIIIISIIINSCSSLSKQSLLQKINTMKPVYILKLVLL